MKIITEPSVYIVGRPSLHTDLIDFLEDHHTDWKSDSPRPAEVLVEGAGRLCYMSFANPRPGGNAAYIKHILEAGHGSVLEHAVWNFIITGVSRSLTHELVRHRAGFAYSQLSQRYVDESDVGFVVPPDLVDDVIEAEVVFREVWGNPEFSAEEGDILLSRGGLTAGEKNGIQWIVAASVAQMSYRRISDYLTSSVDAHQMEKTEARKYARQAARSVLPNATETKIFVTANARALRHFLEQRGSRFAEPEIRRLANHMLEILVVEAPNIFGDYTRTALPDGTFEIDTPYRKV